MARVFLVEDSDNLREVVSSYLKLHNHEVVEFGGTTGILEALETREPDLIILDIMLPDGNGFQLAQKIRKRSGIPIIFLTAKSSESDRITGFETGGDDYVVKPFSPKELVLRVEAILKRSSSGAAQEETIGRWALRNSVLELDRLSHLAKIDGKGLNLTAAEWKILNYLSARNGILVDRHRLMGESLDYFIADGSERTVDTHIKNLRAKLGDRDWIETVRGFGYRFAGLPQ